MYRFNWQLLVLSMYVTILLYACKQFYLNKLYTIQLLSSLLAEKLPTSFKVPGANPFVLTICNRDGSVLLGTPDLSSFIVGFGI